MAKPKEMNVYELVEGTHQLAYNLLKKSGSSIEQKKDLSVILDELKDLLNGLSKKNYQEIALIYLTKLQNRMMKIINKPKPQEDINGKEN